MKKKTSAASKVILTLTLLFFYLPILYIIVFSFNDSRSLTKFGGFSLRWYEKMFADSTMMEAVLYTVVHHRRHRHRHRSVKVEEGPSGNGRARE